MDEVKQWWNKLSSWQKGGVLAGLVLFIIIGISPAPDSNTTVESKPTTPEVRQEEPKKQEQSLADKVDKQYKTAWGIDSYTDFLLSEDYPPESLVGYINRMEDVNNDTIRVFVQTDASEEEAERLAKNILSMVGLDIEELEWVIVQGIDGLDHQASRNDIPALR